MQLTVSSPPCETVEASVLANHSLIYLLARVAPGVLGFLAIALYSRLLDPSAYGVYALILATVQLVNAVLFQWIRVGLSRFLPVSDTPTDLLSALHGAFWILAAGVVALAPLALLFAPTGAVATGVALLVASAWYELCLELLRARIRPVRYAVLTLGRSALGLVLGVALAALGYGGSGVILGIAAGTLLAAVGTTQGSWPSPHPRQATGELIRPLLRYGLPLTGAFALGFVINSSDRLLIGWLLGEGAVGEYAAGYDLARQSIFLMLMGISLASFPLAVRALESGGVEAARSELHDSVVLIYLLGIPATLGLSLLAPNVAATLLGSAFEAEARRLIPWVAAGALLSAVREFHANRAFQLAEDTRGLLAPTAAAAGLNLALNLLLIPRVGIIGAAYATLAAYALSLGLTWVAGRKRFPLPSAPKELGTISLCAAGMAAALLPLLHLRGPAALLLQVFVGAAVFGTLAWTFDAAGARDLLRARFSSSSSPPHERDP